nr:LptF/LptG family permease [Candidatus Hydrogenosomobacter endosymbioticus]
MVLFQKYISRSIIFATLGISCILTTIIWMTQSFRFCSLIAYSGISFSDFLSFFIFLLPNVMMIALPFGFLLAILFVYYKIINDHEMEAALCCGVAGSFFAYPCFAIAVFMVGFLYSISLFLLPISFQEFKKKEREIRSNIAPSILAPKQFIRINGRTIYVSERDAGNVFKNIIVYDESDPKKRTLITGKKASTEASADGGINFVITNGTHQEITIDRSAQPFFLKFKRYTVNLEPRKDFLVEKKPHESFIHELILNRNGGDDEKKRVYDAEILYRIVFPLMPIIFALVSVFVFLKTSAQRKNKWKQPLMATSMVMLFETVILFGLYKFSNPLFSFIMVFAMLFPVIIWLYELFREEKIKAADELLRREI